LHELCTAMRLVPWNEIWSYGMRRTGTGIKILNKAMTKCYGKQVARIWYSETGISFLSTIYFLCFDKNCNTAAFLHPEAFHSQHCQDSGYGERMSR